ncbi:MAG: CPBP family intramembrane metalloprotease [Planctomycetota bacterium]|jgi:membrane protease YdiL (CAAX protease family)|nr:CPBP family intramembrane metalloprotease [Planctomycetota bacterium]
MQGTDWVKEKELTFFDTLPESDPGVGEVVFTTRDVFRFFLVDLIVILAQRVLVLGDLVLGLDQRVALILLGKVVLASYLLWLVSSRRGGWNACGTTRLGKTLPWLLALPILALSLPLLLALSSLNLGWLVSFYRLFGLAYVPAPQDVALALASPELSTWLGIVLFIFTLLVGPALEELAFRGVTLDSLRPARTTFFALAVSAVLFGAYHFDPARLIPLSAFGLLLALFRWWSGSYWCSLALHATYNGIVLALFHFNPVG